MADNDEALRLSDMVMNMLMVEGLPVDALKALTFCISGILYRNVPESVRTQVTEDLLQDVRNLIALHVAGEPE